jgi:hypothetical protein
MLPPGFGQHEFLLRLQQREPADFHQIAAEAGFVVRTGKAAVWAMAPSKL